LDLKVMLLTVIERDPNVKMKRKEVSDSGWVTLYSEFDRRVMIRRLVLFYLCQGTKRRGWAAFWINTLLFWNCTIFKRDGTGPWWWLCFFDTLCYMLYNNERKEKGTCVRCFINPFVWRVCYWLTGSGGCWVGTELIFWLGRCCVGKPAISRLWLMGLVD
jgi:hypothetical protein